MAGKKAKVLTEKAEKRVIKYLQSPESSRNIERNKAMFLLSIKSGLRPKEIGLLTWGMVTNTDGDGLFIDDKLIVPDKITKGECGGRTIPLNKSLKDSLINYYEFIQKNNKHFIRMVQIKKITDIPLLMSEQAGHLCAKSVCRILKTVYTDLEIDGCSAYSGRHTFGTRAAKKTSLCGASIYDVARLMGHSSIKTTQNYIDADSEAHRKLVDII